MWLAIVGYGVAFAGMATLQGRNCGIVEAFQGKCSTTSGPSTQSAPVAGQTQNARLVAAQQQQAGMIGTQPISQV